jgi:hypothetical protein
VTAEIEELPPMGAEVAKIGESIALIAQRVTPLESLPESYKEEQITLVMSSFFDIDTAPLATDVTGPSSLEFEKMAATVTPSVIMVAKEKGSSKPTLAKDEGKGPTKIEEAKNAIEDDTPLVKDLLTKT